MPRFNFIGDIAMGFGGLPGSLNQVIIDNCINPQWMFNDLLIFQQPSDNKLYYYNIFNHGRVQAFDHGANELKTGGGTVAGWLSGLGLFSNKDLGKINTSLAGLYTVGPNGSIGYCPVREAGVGARVKEVTGEDWLLTDEVVNDLQLLGDMRAVWRSNSGEIKTLNLPQPIQVATPAYNPYAIFINNEWWISYYNDAIGLVIHPFNSKFGYRLCPVGQAAFEPCYLLIDNFSFKTNWSANQGQLPQDLRGTNPVVISITSPRIDLSINQDTIVSIDKACYLGWYEFVKPTILPPSNCELSIYETGKIKNLNGIQIFQWHTGSTVEEIENKINASSISCAAYWDKRNWPRYPKLRPNDYLLIQTNCLNTENPKQFEFNIQSILTRIPATYQNVGLSCQCYTSNTDLTSDLKSLVPVYARLARNNPRVKMLLVFSDQGRPTGLNDHPELRSLWQELFNGIKGVPFVPDRPIITIKSYEPKEGVVPFEVLAVAELSGGQSDTITWKLDGQKVVTNPADDLDHHYKITTAGTHRINARVDGPGGFDETAKVREIIAKSGTPQPHPGTKKNVKFGDRYFFVEDGSLFLHDTPTLIEFGDKFVRANDKYAATTPSGIIEVNRDNVDIWEEYNFDFRNNQVSIYSRFWNKYWGVSGSDIRATFDTPTYFDLESVITPSDATIKVAGKFFTREDGTPITIIQCSEFSLYKYYLDGQNIDDILTERAQLGFNCLRVWLLNTSVIPGGLEPKNYGQKFYDQLGPFAQKCADYGFIVEFTVFTQTKTLMPNVDDQKFHLWSVSKALENENNILLELVNENDQHDNECSNQLQQPIGFISSHGSNGADHKGVEPFWDYSQYHTNDLNEWQRKVGHNAMEIADEARIPVISNENMRYPDKDSSPTHAFDAAAGASLLCAGACFHSQSGKFSRLFDDVEKAAAKAWVDGANSVPLKFQNGQYIRRDDLLEPGIIRVYEKRIGGESYILRIRA